MLACFLLVPGRLGYLGASGQGPSTMVLSANSVYSLFSDVFGLLFDCILTFLRQAESPIRVLRPEGVCRGILALKHVIQGLFVGLFWALYIGAFSL